MRPTDLDQVLAIEEASFTQPWRRDGLLNELRHPEARLLVLQDPEAAGAASIIAYICCRRIIDEMELFRLAVAPAWRQKGAATILLEKSLNQAQTDGIATVLLEVRASNRAARQLYQKSGFVTVGKRPDYYSEDREDALVMIKHLKEGV